MTEKCGYLFDAGWALINLRYVTYVDFGAEDSIKIYVVGEEAPLIVSSSRKKDLERSLRMAFDTSPGTLGMR